MKDFERSMRGNLGLDLFQPSNEAGISHELCDDRMIGMAPVLRMSDHDPRLKAPNHERNLGPRLGCVLNSAVGEAEVFANGDAHHFRGLRGLFGSEVRCATARHLPRGEIENRRLSS